jgi:nucleotidyltransferase AbiEii toxin of type IV toxin-antitoxin system
MPLDYLHNHPEFDDLIRIVADRMSIIPLLVEKDYWIMHSLYGIQKMDLLFYLKGGTSLSKGYKIIDRFSEDIDILIDPPIGIDVKIGKNQNKKSHCESRLKFYNFLSEFIKIEGIESVARDTVFDDDKYRSGGIRLYYSSKLKSQIDIKNGILLEVGFDQISPNQPITISSWAYNFAKEKIELKDNRAHNVLCYHPGYTFVEKLQTISTKYRKFKISGDFSENFMRHYYDIYRLLECDMVLNFLGTKAYIEHKNRRFREGDNKNINENEAFLMSDKKTFSQYEAQYNKSRSLYYDQKPEFLDIIMRIRSFLPKL